MSHLFRHGTTTIRHCPMNHANTPHRRGQAKSILLLHVYPRPTLLVPSPQGEVAAGRMRRLVVGARLAVVADHLETANHLADGKEAETLSEDDAAGDDLGVVDIPGLADEVLGGREDAAGLDRLPQALVV